MSSLRVRAQNKLLNKLGAAKPSKNVQFDSAHAQFERTQANVLTLETALRGFIVSLRGFHVSAQVLYGAIEGVGGAPDNSAEMKLGVAELKNAFMRVDVTALDESVKKFENRVMRPASGWMAQAAVLKKQVAEFNDEKLVYDHYTRKVMSLRESRDKRSVSGKQEKPKDVEKLVRNEQKLAATTNAYSKISDKTVTNLREFVNTRETKLAPIVQRVLEFRVQYAARLADESKVFQAMIQQDSAIDSVLSALESFVPQLTGAGATQVSEGSGPSQTGAREPEPPVKALSFESFVGDGPSMPLPGAETTSPEWLPPDMPTLALQLNNSAQGMTSFHDMPPLLVAPHRASATCATTTPTSVAVTLQSPTSPSSANTFFGEDFAPTSPQSMTMAAFHTAPVQPLPPSSPSTANFTPWDEFQPPPPPPALLQQLSTKPASAPSLGWDSFEDMGGADVQKMHQNATH